jgi:flagellar basal-body rod protein FlgB
MLGDLPLFSALKGRMQYHQSRQKLLAENVANADSPGFRPRDLKPFDAALAAQRGSTSGDAGPAKTHYSHLGGQGAGALGSRRSSVFEATQTGNAVNLEDEMMRMSQNNSDYQLATSLYSKSLQYLRLALGKKA